MTILQLYNNGLTMAEIGKQIGMTAPGVRRRLLKFPDFKPRRTGYPPWHGAIRDAAMKADYDSGMTYKAIGEKYGVSLECVFDRVNR